MNKALIFDSSSIISLAMNSLLPELRELKMIFDGDFIITDEVKYEIIDRPLEIKRFALEALQTQELFNAGIFVKPEKVGIKSSEITKMTNTILDKANTIFEVRKKPVHIIDKGEASCMALNRLLLDKGYKSVIVVDERTTRILGEKPENMRKLLEKKLHMNVSQVNDYNILNFKGFRFIRSSELIYVAYKKNLTKIKGKKGLDAMLWSLKFKGAAISDEEIKEIEKIN